MIKCYLVEDEIVHIVKTIYLTKEILLYYTFVWKERYDELI